MNKKKTLLATILVAILLTASIGGTLAWLEDRSGPVVNQFTPSQVDTELDEEKDGTQKTRIAVFNKVDSIPVYVRVMLVGNWYDEDGKVVEAWNGVVDYNTANWTKNGEYYYYNSVLQPGDKTPNLLKSPIKATANNGYQLKIMVVHQAIQAEGMNASGAIDAFAKAEAVN